MTICSLDTFLNLTVKKSLINFYSQLTLRKTQTIKVSKKFQIIIKCAPTVPQLRINLLKAKLFRKAIIKKSQDFLSIKNYQSTKIPILTQAYPH